MVGWCSILGLNYKPRPLVLTTYDDMGFCLGRTPFLNVFIIIMPPFFLFYFLITNTPRALTTLLLKSQALIFLDSNLLEGIYTLYNLQKALCPLFFE